jgi:hypothetical protein
MKKEMADDRIIHIPEEVPSESIHSRVWHTTLEDDQGKVTHDITIHDVWWVTKTARVPRARVQPDSVLRDTGVRKDAGSREGYGDQSSPPIVP